jgi:hypothetical protein
VLAAARQQITASNSLAVSETLARCPLNALSVSCDNVSDIPCVYSADLFFLEVIHEVLSSVDVGSIAA